jgi:hypothetical protein
MPPEMLDPTRCSTFDHTCDDCMLPANHLDPGDNKQKGFNMDKLDAALKKLDLEFLAGVPVQLTDEMIEQIKQAFIDAGWRRPSKAQLYYEEVVKQNKRLDFYKAIDAYLDAGGPTDFVVMSRNDWQRNAKLAGLMTGQEWYDRWKAEAEKVEVGNAYHELRVMQQLYKAAKKAAGIEL